jgi:restriction system protein
VGVDVAVPDFQSLFRPVLEVTSDNQVWTNKAITTAVADRLELSSSDRQERLKSGQPRLQNRIAWAIIYLSRAGALRREGRGLAQITERGHELLKYDRQDLNVRALEQFEEFREFQQRKGTVRGPKSQETNVDGSEDPLEKIDSALSDIDSAVAAELIERIKLQSAEFLEHLVLKLMKAMNYGVLEGSAEHIGGPGDEGFDGVVRLDALGLERIYLQAKRYSENTVGRPAIQSFVGALTGAGATRGVFITTSRFSADAIAYAQQVPMSIVLIDGDELGRLLIRYQVGVQVKQQVAIVQIDDDFFEE